MKKERREVRNLIVMFSSAIFIAFVVVVGLSYYFGSSGTHLLRNVLISPEVLEEISFHGQEERFVFNKIEYIRTDKQGTEWGRFAVSLESYKILYKKIANERSVPQLTDEITSQFRMQMPAILTIFAQAREPAQRAKDGVIFQQVEFLEDIFRVQIRVSEENGGEWVYFRYPGIGKLADETLAPAFR